MLESYLSQSGYRVNKGNHTLYDAASASTLTLIGSLPSIPFRCSVRLYTATGKTDCVGRVTVGSENLDFLAAGKKTTTTLLTALPVITTTNLNCVIEILVIDSGGAPIPSDTQTALDCRFQDTQKSFRNPMGEWSQSQAIAYTDDSSCAIGTLFSYGGYDYQIAQVSVMTGLDGLEEGRKLYLTGKALAPSGREVVDVIGDMRKAIYDSDLDGVVDKAEGIPVLSEIPTDLSAYAEGDMFLVGDTIWVVKDS